MRFRSLKSSVDRLLVCSLGASELLCHQFTELTGWCYEVYTLLNFRFRGFLFTDFYFREFPHAFT